MSDSTDDLSALRATLAAIQAQLARIEARQKGDAAQLFADQLESTTCPWCYDRIPNEHYDAHRRHHAETRP